mmetsp:Transcript_69592/g.163621  ORF Transcript_69592/g.163621 Transcript_69592/m.163621 type:complete len:345 (-) Transcript_69592:772-1806(-)
MTRRVTSKASAGSSSHQSVPASSRRRSTSMSACQRRWTISTAKPVGPKTHQASGGSISARPSQASVRRERRAAASIGMPRLSRRAILAAVGCSARPRVGAPAAPGLQGSGGGFELRGDGLLPLREFVPAHLQPFHRGGMVAGPVGVFGQALVAAHQMVGDQPGSDQGVDLGLDVGVTEGEVVVVQADGRHQRGRQIPDPRHQCADDGMVGLVVGVLGRDIGAVDARCSLHHRRAIAAHALQQHRHAHVQEQAEAVGQVGRQARQLAGDGGHRDRPLGAALPEARELGRIDRDGVLGQKAGHHRHAFAQADARHRLADGRAGQPDGLEQRTVGDAQQRGRHRDIA